MRKGIFALGVWMLALAPLSAQTYQPPPPAYQPPPPAYQPPPPAPAQFPSEGVGPPAQPPQPALPPYGLMPSDPLPVMPAPLVLRPVYDPNAYRIWMRAELL